MAQLHAIRREQGRMAELEAAAAAFVEGMPDVPGWRMGLAMIYISTGQLDKARPHFDYLARDGFAHIPRDAVWMAAMAGCAEICAALGDADRAAELYELLLPYQERCVVISFGFAIVGSVAHFLGQLAAVLRRWDEALRHFEAATDLQLRIDAKPALGRTWYEHARALLARGQAADRPQAEQLLAQARKTANELGMERLQAQASAAAEAITDDR
jgi:tetratricopeptide (TPR) repeat protein